MLNIDMWYNNTFNPETDIVTVCFYPNDCIYRGNIKRNGKYIGDFSGNDSIEIAKRFGVKWDD